MRPRSTSAVKVHPIPDNSGSRCACEWIQPLSAFRTVAAARRTSIVSGRSQNPSRKPRTAISAASRPPFVLPMPSDIAATTSRRGSGSSGPKTAPAKSSLRLRGPVSEANPTLTLTLEIRSAIAAAPIPRGARAHTAGRLDRDAAMAPPRFFGITASILQPAPMIEEIAAGARGHDHRKFLGFAVKRVVPAIGRLVPRNLGVADAGRIGIDRSFVVVDPHLPIRTTGNIGAGNRGLAARRLTAESGTGHADRPRANSRR